MKTIVHFVAVVERDDQPGPQTWSGTAPLPDDVDPDDRSALLRFLTAVVTNLLGPTLVAVLEILVDHFTHR